MIKRIVLLASLLLTIMSLGGCSGDEHQRIAFLHFLKTQILEAPALQVPVLTEEQREAFGKYSRYYLPIESFQLAIAQQVEKPTVELIQKLAPQPLPVILERRNEISQTRRQIRDLEMIVVVEQEKAREAYVRFKPDLTGELKTVYDQAFNKTVMQPSDAYKKQIVAGVFGVLDSAWKVVDYAESQKNRFNLNGSLSESANPIMQQIDKQLHTLIEKAEQLIREEPSMRAAVFAERA